MLHLRQLSVAALTALLACNAAVALDANRSLDCLVEPHVVIEISSPVPGVIGSIDVEKSDLVERGQALARLESAVWESTVREARSRARASAAVDSARVNVAFAERNHTRIAELFEKGVVATHHLDEARTEVDLANADLKRALENRQLAKLELQRAEESLRQRTIRSPIDAVVVSRHKSPGEFVEVSPILALAQLDPLKIQVIAPASLFGTIHEGMQGDVQVETSGKTYKATVSLVDRIVDGASGSFGVQLELPNPDYEVPVGLRCQVSIAAADAQAPKPVQKTDAEAVTAATIAAPSAAPAKQQVTKGAQRSQPQPAVRNAVAKGSAAPNRPAECISIGPITDDGLAGRIEAGLSGLDVPFARRETTVASGYLLLTPPQSSQQAARQLTDDIRKAGVKDVATLIRPPYANRVSLGFFTKRAIAEGRRDELSKLQIDTTVVQRRRRGAGVWLDVQTSESGATRSAVADLLKGGDVASLSDRKSCVTSPAPAAPDAQLHASHNGAGG